MAPSVTLGGFKVLKDAIWFSMSSPAEEANFPARFCSLVAQEKINLPFLTCIREGRAWCLNTLVDAADEKKISTLIEQVFGRIFSRKSESIILSIFPHKHNPWIIGTFLETLGREGLRPEALANSPAAISVVMRKELLPKAGKALFGPFRFSAYRTTDDWKLVQRGRETLYKEVVASYQERRPRVYGLRYREGQECVYTRFEDGRVDQFGPVLKQLDRLGLKLTFLATSPCREKGQGHMILCVSRPINGSSRDIMQDAAPDLVVEGGFSAAMFSMTGPHFGDRYGIASELLTALDRAEVDLLGLNCSISSIKGVVLPDQIQPAIQAIRGSFEVPAVTKKE
jgi:aspartokinase